MMNPPAIFTLDVIVLIVAFTVLVLRTVNGCKPLCVPAATEPKLSDDGVTEMVGRDATPVPERSILSGIPAVPLLVESIRMAPEYACPAIGLNVTARVHGEPSVTPAAQVPPVMVMREVAVAGVIEVMLDLTAPTRLIVNTCEVLLPTALLPNANGDAGLTERSVLGAGVCEYSQAHSFIF